MSYGFFLCGLFSFCLMGLEGGVFMMIGHGFCSSFLFFILFVLYERMHTRSVYLLKGVFYSFSFLGIFIFFSVFLNMGVPLSLSFFSEVFIVVGSGSVNLFSFFFVFSLMLFSGVYSVYIFLSVLNGVSLLGGFFRFVCSWIFNFFLSFLLCFVFCCFF